MQLGEISFCNKPRFNIKQDIYKKHILDELEQLYGFKIVQKHHDHMNLDSSHVQRRLKTIPFLVSVKTNGNPYLLYLTKYNFVNQCIFIDKKIQHGYFLPRMIVVKMWFNDELFNGTLFDGEMVKTHNDKWIFVLSDIIAHKGQSTSQLKLPNRINLIYDTLVSNYLNDDTEICTLQVKKYFPIEKLSYIVQQFIPSLEYTCRGLYFNPIYSNILRLLHNFNDTLVKPVVRQKCNDVNKTTFLTKHDTSLKHQHAYESVEIPNAENVTAVVAAPAAVTATKQSCVNNDMTLFTVKKTKVPDIYEMKRVDDKNHDKVIACVQNMATSKMMNEIFSNLTFIETIEMWCTYNDKFQKWVPKCTLKT